MKTITIEGIGSLSETQIRNLVNNARKLRAENIVLKEELTSIKEVRT